MNEKQIREKLNSLNSKVLGLYNQKWYLEGGHTLSGEKSDELKKCLLEIKKVNKQIKDFEKKLTGPQGT